MIRVVHSNRVEALADALAEALPAADDASGLFEGPWLVVPTRPLTLWLNLALARRRGIAGHVDTMTFDGMFARLTSESMPDVVLIERGHIVSELLALLVDQTVMGDAALAPLASYLRAAGDDAAAIDRRRVDLALALGRLFDEWTLRRPEALKGWRGSGRDATPDADPLERAERAIYRALFGAEGRFARRGAAEGRRYLTSEAFVDAGLASSWRPPSAVHLFAPYDVSPGVQLTLARLGQRTDVRVYAVNPCREFWEDVETGDRSAAARAMPGVAPASASTRIRPRGRHAPPDPRQLDLLAPPARPALPLATGAAPAEGPAGNAGENPWLGAWGRAGRELVTRLNALTDQNSEFRSVQPGAEEARSGTILAHVQRDILERRPRREGGDRLALDADGSITLLGAPNPRREIESVAAEIWRLIRADERARAEATEAHPPTAGTPLRFSDIAVLVAGPAEPHLSLVPEVFHEAEELPHAIVDRGFDARSGLADAVLALVALALGPLTRREVLDVITHTNVRARFPDADPAVWLQLCDALTIAHGADRAAHAGTYIDRDAFNWDQGCRRLVLGRFARGPRSGVEEPLPLSFSLPPSSTVAPAAPDAGYSPAEVGPDLRDDADALAVLMRSLLADVHFARSARLTIPEWTRFVRALMSAYVVPLNPDDEAARLAVFAALDQLSGQSSPEVAVPLVVAVELLRAALGELRGARGQMLGAGVVVGSLGALRALPFRVIFVVGLEPARFPSLRGPSPLDVLAGSAGPSEVSPRDNDRYLFLEALLAARERLVLTAVDRDPLTGEPREPSSVALELLDELGRGYVADGAALVHRVPLHRDEDPATCAAFPAAAIEARARLLGEAARAAGAAGAADPAAMISALAPAARDALAPVLGLVRPATPATDNETGPGRASAHRQRTVLTLVDLRRFLECPLQGGARVTLGLRDLPDESDARETADEPFDVPRALERGLLTEVMLAAWSGEAPPDLAHLVHRYDEATARYRAAYRLPAALFRDNVRLRHQRVLGQWLDRITTAVPALRGPARRLCFGRPEPFAPPAERRDALRLHVELPGRGLTEIELQGTTEPQIALAPDDVWPDGLEGSLILASSPYNDQDDRDSVRGLIDAMTIAASSPAGAPPSTRFALVCRPSRNPHQPPPAPYLLRFPNLTAATARAYLTGLVSALLGRHHDYLFPIDAVMRATDRPMSLVDAIEQTRVDPFYSAASAANFGPVPDPFAYPAPTEAEAVHYRDERLGPLLAARAAARGKAAGGPGGANGTSGAAREGEAAGEGGQVIELFAGKPPRGKSS